MESIRKPTIQEEKLIQLLVNKSSKPIPDNWKNGLLVCPMDDGEMGGLCLFPRGYSAENRVFGGQVSDFQFLDIDGIEVIASLNLDSHGELFELDMWKVDFGKLLQFPSL